MGKAVLELVIDGDPSIEEIGDAVWTNPYPYSWSALRRGCNGMIYWKNIALSSKKMDGTYIINYASPRHPSLREETLLKKELPLCKTGFCIYISHRHQVRYLEYLQCSVKGYPQEDS